jgi:hypothetical protein
MECSNIFYGGEMAPFNPKEYKRYIVVFNLFRKDCIRLVFPSGDKVDDGSGFLQGDYADGRRLALFSNMDEVQSKKTELQQVIRKWLGVLDKN